MGATNSTVLLDVPLQGLSPPVRLATATDDTVGNRPRTLRVRRTQNRHQPPRFALVDVENDDEDDDGLGALRELLVMAPLEDASMTTVFHLPLDPRQLTLPVLHVKQRMFSSTRQVFEGGDANSPTATIKTSRRGVRMTFVDRETGAETTVFTEQAHQDRVAIVWLERGPSLAPIARMTRTKLGRRSDRVSLEVASGVDLVVVGLLWFARQQELEVETGAALVDCDVNATQECFEYAARRKARST